MQLTRLFGVLLAGMGLVCVEGKADDTAGEDKAKATFGDKTIERVRFPFFLSSNKNADGGL